MTWRRRRAYTRLSHADANLAVYLKTGRGAHPHEEPHQVRALLPRWPSPACCLAACGDSDSTPCPTPRPRCRTRCKNIVVIYAENRSFDNLYGNFPGANGLSTVVDASGNADVRLHPAEGPRRHHRAGHAAADLERRDRRRAAAPSITAAQSAGLKNAPFAIETAFTATRPAPARSWTPPPSRATCTTASSRTRCPSTAARTTCSPPGKTPAA